LHHILLNLAYMLDDGGTASQVDFDDLDHIIADLVAIRHRSLTEVEPGDTIRTTVTERADHLRFESRAIDSYCDGRRSCRFPPGAFCEP
jgi:hypothetical protein